jgi:hypothetical protein
MVTMTALMATVPRALHLYPFRVFDASPKMFFGFCKGVILESLYHRTGFCTTVLSPFMTIFEGIIQNKKIR